VTLNERVGAIIARVMKLKPVRVFTWYVSRRGPLMSNGLSYQAIFAVFAAIWVGFAIAGSVIASRPELQAALFDLLETNVPGLIDDGSGTGAIDPQVLLQAGILGWTGLVAAVVLFFTALGWLAAGRDAVRAMFRMPEAESNFVLVWLKDLGLALGFGALILISAALSVLSTTALGVLFDWVGINERSDTAYWIGRVVGILLVLGLDTLVLALFYRVVSGIAIPFRLLAQGTILAAVALSVLKILGTALLGGATNNPLLASFAVIIGLLIWFNLICQVILLGAAWIAVSADDKGVDLAGRKRTKKVSTAG